jgi:RNA polymerase sigma-70 factor (ECF subfamily)
VSEIDDQELIRRTLDGDGAAYEVLVERYQRRVYRIAFAIVRDPGEADSVTQDAFVQGFLKLSTFEGRSGFETWLTRIAINCARNTLRRRRFVSIFAAREDEDEEGEVAFDIADQRPSVERQLISNQLRAAIERAETKLSAQQKVIFRLRHYENLALEDIAEHLGLQSGTVRAHLFRAIHKIRRELATWRNTPRINHEPALH